MNPYCHGRRGSRSAGGRLRCLFGLRSPNPNKFKTPPPPSASTPALAACLSSEVSTGSDGCGAGRLKDLRGGRDTRIC